MKNFLMERSTTANLVFAIADFRGDIALSLGNWILLVQQCQGRLSGIIYFGVLLWL